MPITPEDRARLNIDKLLMDAGWIVQDKRSTNLSAGRGVAVREFPLKSGHGEADYLLFVDGAPLGVVEAKKEGDTLTGVELQTTKYSEGVPDNLATPRRPLPFQYQSTGVETRYTNLLEPEARSRRVFSFHRPDTLDQWLTQELQHPGSTLRARLRTLPLLMTEGLRSAQIAAIRNLEKSLAQDRPRALIQMASGGGKTFTACNLIYRLIKHAGAKRILFLVDRSNLGRQTLAEFQKFRTPEENRLFTELYNVQRMQSNKLDDVSKVCVTTIQRLYAMLQGKEIDPELEEQSGFETSLLQSEPVPVSYSPSLPIETFDFIVTDECHRSIYNLWRQVLEYFDSFIVGLTATPSKQTLGFFNQNLVMEYSHEQAVADSVNVGFEVYRIRTMISEHGSTVNAGFYVDKRDKLTRKVRWQQLDDDFKYAANELDRSVVAKDQIRTIIQSFRDRLFTEIFPGRTEVPKTLIFAKDDSHADDIVQIVREELGKGNDFAQKITYRTGTARVVNKKKAEDGSETEEVTWINTGAKPEHLLSSFRNSYNPRIAVTVDMIATGTDIKPLEIVFFMRSVRSRNFFEQMKGRGTRVIESDELQAVLRNSGAHLHRYFLVDQITEEIVHAYIFGASVYRIAAVSAVLLRSSAGQAHLLRTAAAIVTNGNRRCAAPGGRRRERNLDKAARPCRYAATTGVSLSKICCAGSRDRNPGDAYGSASLIAQCDPLGETLGAYRLIAEVQAGRTELNVGSNACEGNLLRTGWGVVGDRDGTHQRADGRGLESYRECTACS